MLEFMGKVEARSNLTGMSLFQFDARPRMTNNKSKRSRMI